MNDTPRTHGNTLLLYTAFPEALDAVVKTVPPGGEPLDRAKAERLFRVLQEVPHFKVTAHTDCAFDVHHAETGVLQARVVAPELPRRVQKHRRTATVEPLEISPELAARLLERIRAIPVTGSVLHDPHNKIKAADAVDALLPSLATAQGA